VRLRHGSTTWIWARSLVERTKPSAAQAQVAAAARSVSSGSGGGGLGGGAAFRVGDVVRIRSVAVDEVRLLQNGHGKDSMQKPASQVVSGVAGRVSPNSPIFQHFTTTWVWPVHGAHGAAKFTPTVF
jgi:hypothetical protein